MSTLGSVNPPDQSQEQGWLWSLECTSPALPQGQRCPRCTALVPQLGAPLLPTGHIATLRVQRALSTYNTTPRTRGCGLGAGVRMSVMSRRTL